MLVTIVLLGVLAFVVWNALLHEDRRGLLTVSFLDIGQGDAIFIDAPSGRQALIDGGPGASVLQRLGEVLPWYDRSIDVVIGTHPDKDHIGGLVDVLERYHVDSLFQSSVQGETAIWNTFEKRIAEKQHEGMHLEEAERGRIIDLGSSTGSTGSTQASSGQGVHAYIEILCTDRSVPGLETNTGCVVSRLVYGETSFMLPCDAPRSIEEYLVYLSSTSLKSDVLKAGHHGSRTSSSPLFVGFVDPKYVVYSRGCDNTYGFPHEETVATFKSFNILVEDTCKEGTVTFVSDGKTVALKK